MRTIGSQVMALVLLAATSAFAEVTVVREIPGYRCMSLNLNSRQMMDAAAEVPVFEQPSTASPKLAAAGAIILANDPINNQTGFTEVLLPSGRRGWIAQSYLKPWRPVSGQPGHCGAAQLSNGRLGFSFKE